MSSAIRVAVMASLLVPMGAQAMTVRTFLAKAKALQAQGTRAEDSPDFGLVRDAVKDAAAAYREQIDANKKAHKPPRACPPPTGQAKVDAAALIADFQAIPSRKRGITVEAALFTMMDKRYPCDDDYSIKPITSSKATKVSKASHAKTSKAKVRHKAERLRKR